MMCGVTDLADELLQDVFQGDETEERAPITQSAGALARASAPDLIVEPS